MVQRIQLLVVCAGFVVLTLTQQPGRIVADTKLDLAVDPWAFLGRALQLWEPQGFAGQVQNQAYGYLFPMGPFFGLGESAGLPVWVVQRLWAALLLCVAFLGVVALARRLRIGTPESQLVAGLVFALAPRMISGIGATSVEVLPMALAPWVLVPLVAGAREGSPRRAAALSGLAVFCVGGVNAVATAAVLPLAAVYLLTRAPGPRRRRLMAWWAGAVVLATSWWVLPLLVLGRYSPPFLDYIESAATTTRPTGLLSVLRGTTQWVAHLARPDGPLWPAGWDLVHDTLPIVATVALAAVGLLGLTRANLPERSWLVLGLATGLVLVTAGHLGPVQGLLADPVNSALDGALAPLRNVHKFDPVLRIPLALAVGHVCGELFDRVRRTGRDRLRPLARAGIGLIVLLLVVVASPAVGGRLTAPTGFGALPTYWQDTADWLEAAQPSGRALLLPASSFGTYAWGSTSDEPLQPLARSPWEVRNAIPLTPAAHIRMLDAVEDRLSRGSGSAGLTRYLARAGISHLVVRNDLDAGAAGATRPVLVHQALHDSPGITRVATFGPRFPGSDSLFGRALDAYLATPRPAVEIYAVADPAPPAYTTPLADAVTVAGGPDAVLALEERGMLTDRPALVADGAGEAAPTVMVSDAQLRRERTFGRTGAAVSAGLTAEDPLRLDGPARDYLYPGAEAGESVVVLDGGTVSASSSASDADSFGVTRPEDQPYAAIDGDISTAWRPANLLGEPQPVWWRVTSDRPITTRSIVVQLADDADADVPARLRLTTDSGERIVRLSSTPRPQELLLPPGTTTGLTISAVGGADGRTADDLAIAEVRVPGLDISRTVATPVPDGAAAVYAFDVAHPAAAGCVDAGPGRLRCAGQLVHAAEEPRGIDRVLTVPQAADHAVTVTVAPRPGRALDALIDAAARPAGPEVRASSSAVPDPRGGADAAVDGDPGTSWAASPSDTDPELTLRWNEFRTVDRLRVVFDRRAAASRPTAVTVSVGGLDRTVELAADGTAVFPAVTTDQLTLSFPLRDELTSFDPYTRLVTSLGVGVSELEIDGVTAGDPDTVVDVPCGEGPGVLIDGQRRETSLRTTLGGLRALRPIELSPCPGGGSTGPLSAGEHRFTALSTASFSVLSATLVRAGNPGAGSSGERTAVEMSRWDAEHRAVQVGPRSAATLLVVPENINPGWVATLDGRALEPRTVDGWQQGYVLPAGSAGEVRLDFAPGSTYRAALLTGAAGLVLLAVLLLVPARRPSPPPTGRHRTTGGLLIAVLVAATGLIGGPLGLVALAGVVVLGRVAGRHRPLVLGMLASSALLAAGAVALATGTVWQSAPGNTGVPVAQTLALVAVAAALAAALPDRRRDRSRTSPRQRRLGRSTSR